MMRRNIILFTMSLALTMALYAMHGATPVSAGGTVTNCNGDADFNTQLSGGGMINFSCGTATILLSSQKTITTSTTIDGGGTITLNGGGLRHFSVNSGVTLTLTNIIIRGGYANADGGAISNNGTVNIINSKFFSNTTDSLSSGGAIVSYGPLNITNSEFAYNSAGNGGALYPRWSPAVTTISASNFHDNYTTSSTNGWGGVILQWDGAPATIDSTIMSANHAQQGGGVYVYANSVLTVTNSIVNGNFGDVGGGGFYVNGMASIKNSRLTSNSARGLLAIFGQGGGIFVAANGVLTLDDSTLSDDHGGFGGGILNAGTATLNNSTLTGNYSQGMYYGGGIYNSNVLTLNGVTLNGNVATGDGGGIANAGSATLINSTLSGNSAWSYGGGIGNYGSVTVTNVTLNLNSATLGGGGLYHLASSATSAFLLKNTIVANSTAGNNCSVGAGSGTSITSSGYNLSSDSSCQSYFTQSTDLPINTDPNLGPLANNGGPTSTHMPLTPDSPGIDRIPKFTNGCGTTLITDQRGGARPINLKCDIGAVEFGASLPWLYLPLILR